jgi:hypothetical protein
MWEQSGGYYKRLPPIGGKEDHIPVNELGVW